MSLLRHIALCNTYAAARFLPLRRGTVPIGRVRRDNVERLRRFPKVFAITDEGIDLIADGGFAELSRAVDEVVEAIIADGLIPKWRDEFFTVAPRWGGAPLFKVDRGALAFFGVRAYGVHLNGFRGDPATAAPGGPLLWIGRRALDKRVAPGKLDNLVAGGIGHGHGVRETLAKEAGEEADIPPELIARARPAGIITYKMAMGPGMRDDVLFLYDLEVPGDFIPRNTDGELVDFSLMPAAEVIERVRRTDDFKFNVNLVLIDFALRHGLIAVEDPDYLALVTGLHRPLDEGES
jgi:hypothetical protein